MKTKLKSDIAISITLFIIIVAIPIIGYQLNRAPEAISESAPLTEFSAVRAMKHLEYIAAEPHSIGTAAHARVRSYIIDQLKMMEVEPEIQTAEVFYSGSYLAATVKNIIVRLPGTVPGKSVLVVGHYDSVPDSYGASDDGSGIVTMLETIRVLLLKQHFKNDIIFLFSDGEEIGLTGAKAFVDEHPLAKNTGVVLNFEGGGTTGPSMMFETSTENNWIISEFAKVVHYPIANSVFYEVYRNMPNDTDLSPFKKKGYKGFNFSYSENRFDYHSGGDNLKNTSVESIQHHGSYAIPLIEHFANIDLNNTEKGNAVFFNTVGKGFVHYAYKWILPFSVLTCLMLLGILYIGFRKKLLRPLRLLFGFIAFIIHLVIAPAIVTLVYFILIRYHPGNDFMLLNYNQNILLIGFVGVATAVSFLFFKSAMKGIRMWQVLPFVALVIVLLIWSGRISVISVIATVVVAVTLFFLFRKPTNVWELLFGSFIGWAIIMVVASIMMPGVSHLFTWPLLFSVIPVGIYFLRKNHNDYSIVQLGLFLLATLPALLWFSYFTYLFHVTMGLKMAGGAILISVLCLSLLIIPIEIITRKNPWLIPLLSFSSGLFFLLYGSVHLQYSERYKKQNSLILATNGNSNETFFTSYDYTDEWLIDYLSDQPDTSKLNDFFPNGNRDYIKKTVATENLPAPGLIVMHDSIVGGQKILKFHLNSNRKADELFIYIKSDSDSDSVKVAIDKSGMKELKLVEGAKWYVIRYFALPEEGIDMELKVSEKQNPEIILVDYIYGLPVLHEFKIKERPDYMMSKGDMTMATKKFIL